MKRSITWCEKIAGKNSTFSASAATTFGLIRRKRILRAKAPEILARFPKPPHAFAGAPNQITVTLTRISPGYLDDDGLIAGDFVHVRDGVADWLGLDDRDSRVRFEYRQQGCPLRQFAARIEVDDLSTGDDLVHVEAGVPERLSEVVARAA